MSNNIKQIVHLLMKATFSSLSKWKMKHLAICSKSIFD